ncbi:MAG: phosphate-starvation-inducible PsiE family protein [Thermoproteus sp.]
MDYVKWLRIVEVTLYGIALAITVILACYSFYLVAIGVINLASSMSESSIYYLLGNLFLFIIFIELIDTFITYIQHKEVIVYKIIDIALVALARELLVYMSPVNSNFDLVHASTLVASVFVVGFVDYLQHRRERA